MTRAHTTAVVTRIGSAELAGIVYWDKPIPDTVKRYLRVRTNSGSRHPAAERLTGPLGPIRQTFWLTGVGTTPDQAAWVLEHAGSLLTNWIPTVTGWSCRRLTLEASQPVDMDPDIDGRYFGVDQWDLAAEPTA